MRILVNPRGSVKYLEDSSANQMLKVPGWLELDHDPKTTYLPQYDRGIQVLSTSQLPQSNQKFSPTLKELKTEQL